MLTLIQSDDYPCDLKEVLDDLLGDITNYSVYEADAGYKIVCQRTPIKLNFFIAEDEGCGGSAVYYNSSTVTADDSNELFHDICLAFKPGVYEEDDEYERYVSDNLRRYTYDEVRYHLSFAYHSDSYNKEEALEAIFDTLINIEEPFNSITEVIQFQEENGIYPFNKKIHSSRKVTWLN